MKRILDDIKRSRTLDQLGRSFAIEALPALYKRGEPAVIAQEETADGTVKLKYIPIGSDAFELRLVENEKWYKAHLSYRFNYASHWPFGFHGYSKGHELDIEETLIPRLQNEAIKRVAVTARDHSSTYVYGPGISLDFPKVA